MEEADEVEEVGEETAEEMAAADDSISISVVVAPDGVDDAAEPTASFGEPSANNSVDVVMRVVVAIDTSASVATFGVVADPTECGVVVLPSTPAITFATTRTSSAMHLLSSSALGPIITEGC